MCLTAEKVELDGYGKGILNLSASHEGRGKTDFTIGFTSLVKRKPEQVLLRKFTNNLLKAVRSYRRFVLLSDEIRQKRI